MSIKWRVINRKNNKSSFELEIIISIHMKLNYNSNNNFNSSSKVLEYLNLDP